MFSRRGVLPFYFLSLLAGCGVVLADIIPDPEQKYDKNCSNEDQTFRLTLSCDFHALQPKGGEDLLNFTFWKELPEWHGIQTDV